MVEEGVELLGGGLEGVVLAVLGEAEALELVEVIGDPGDGLAQGQLDLELDGVLGNGK